MIIMIATALVFTSVSSVVSEGGERVTRQVPVGVADRTAPALAPG
jgi:hypothetical protein